MEVVKPTPPSGPESPQSERSKGESGRAVTFTVYAADRREPVRPLGHVTVRPGLVAPGHVAAVRTPDGLLRLRKIHYYRDGAGRECVRLESLGPGEGALQYPLEVVVIEGVVICVCGIDEECGCD